MSSPATDAALKQIAHAKLLGDLRRLHGLALVGEGGVARDHEQVRDARQLRGEVLCDAVGKIALLLVVAQIVEGEHHE
jgi:hypothetical protein